MIENEEITALRAHLRAKGAEMQQALATWSAEERDSEISFSRSEFLLLTNILSNIISFNMLIGGQMLGLVSATRPEESDTDFHKGYAQMLSALIKTVDLNISVISSSRTTAG